MTEQEAIKNVTAYVYMECENMPQQVIKALDIMRECTEKQIPKEPLPIITDDNEFVCDICPSCQSTAIEVKDNYCRFCGQRLDWRNEDAE